MRHELFFHTDEQIAEAVAFAVGVAMADNVPAELRVAAFTAVVNLKVQKQVVQDAPPTLGVPAMAIPGKL